VLARPQARSLWFASYLQTYLERDVRAITNVRDLVTFRRSLSLLASRHGQVLNKTDLAAPLGVSIGVGFATVLSSLDNISSYSNNYSSMVECLSNLKPVRRVRVLPSRQLQPSACSLPKGFLKVGKPEAVSRPS